MSDITQPGAVVDVRWREESTRDDAPPKEPPPKKVAESYEENARAISDTITILGIPIELMTHQIQAAIAGLVAEADYLKAMVRRFEKEVQGAAEAAKGAVVASAMTPEGFTAALGSLLSSPPEPGHHRELALMVVNTYEDIRRSSGLLPANAVLSDVVQRLSGSNLGANLVGLVGGPVIGVLMTVPEQTQAAGEDDALPGIAERIKAVAEGEAYTVAGLDMALSFTVVATPVETGQSALQAIGRADHVLRG